MWEEIFEIFGLDSDPSWLANATTKEDECL